MNSPLPKTLQGGGAWKVLNYGDFAENADVCCLRVALVLPGRCERWGWCGEEGLVASEFPIELVIAGRDL
jgi:hypothetical protein